MQEMRTMAVVLAYTLVLDIEMVTGRTVDEGDCSLISALLIFYTTLNSNKERAFAPIL